MMTSNASALLATTPVRIAHEGVMACSEGGTATLSSLTLIASSLLPPPSSLARSGATTASFTAPAAAAAPAPVPAPPHTLTTPCC
eukprot:4746397-Alexandrium_andersonii.AAC.1